MMRTWTLVLLLLFTNPAFAKKRSLRFDTGRSGAGFILGKPASFRYNYWLNWKRSLYLDVGYNWEQVLMATFSYSFYFYDVKDLWRAKNKTNALLFYLAPGVFTGYNTGTSDPGQTIYLGGRAVGGVEYLFAGMPLSLRAEVGPALYALGKTIGGVQGGVGLTYYFGSTNDADGKDAFTDSDKEGEGELNLDEEFGGESGKTPKSNVDELSLDDVPQKPKKANSEELDLDAELENQPEAKPKSSGTSSKVKPSAKSITKPTKAAPKKGKAPAKPKEDLSEFE